MIEEYEPELFDLYRQFVKKGEEPDPNDVPTQRLREDIIVSNIYLCSRVVGKMKKSMPPHVERDDLESWAKIGLMQAVTRFDASLGVPFEAFATQRMRSVIMDGIRDLDWAPRSLRKKSRDIAKVEESFRQEWNRDPTDEETARILAAENHSEDLTLEQYEDNVTVLVDEISRTKHQSEISSHTYIEGSLEAQNKPVTLNEDEDDLVYTIKQTVSKALSELPVKQAAIVALHYYAEKNLATIASMLSISEVKVGTLHSEAVLYIWQKVQQVLKDA